MLGVIIHAWTLFVGLFLLMIGNGMQGTALGLRGAVEAFDTTTMGIVMSGYFVGFLGGAQATPWLIRKVGHVRVFAALASLISAAFLVYAAVPDPLAWTAMRVIVGFGYSGVYVVVESWLNAGASNANRGAAMSAYMLVQTLAIILGQAALNLADPAGYGLFVLMSVAVSVAVVPMLLSAGPAPVFETGRAMGLRQLFRTSPLGCVGMVALGGIFACLFGMSAVFGTERGLGTAEISILVGGIYGGGLVAQAVLARLADRMDRRRLIAAVTATGAVAALAAGLTAGPFWLLVLLAAAAGGLAMPLYALLIAHTNDFLAPEEMAAASGGLILINGVGAIGAPIFVGWLMRVHGPGAYWAFMAACFGAIALYALWRMTRRPAPRPADTLPVAPIGPAATPMTAVLASDAVIGAAEREEAFASSRPST